MTTRATRRLGRYGVRFSPLLLAVALAPALMQTQFTCVKTGDPTLSILELEVLGENRIVGFEPEDLSYDVWLPLAADTAMVRAYSTDPGAQVMYNYHTDAGPIDNDYLPVGGGERTLDGLLVEGESMLLVSVKAPGGATHSYVIGIRVGCSNCDDDNDCTIDVCNTAEEVCAHTQRPDSTVCSDGVSSGLCVAGTCSVWSDPELVDAADTPDAAYYYPAFVGLEVNPNGDFVALSVRVTEFDTHSPEESFYGSVVAHPSHEIIGSGVIEHYDRVSEYLGRRFDLGIDSVGRAFATFETYSGYDGETYVYVKGIDNEAGSNAAFFAGYVFSTGHRLDVGVNGEALLIWELYGWEAGEEPVVTNAARYSPASGWQQAQVLTPERARTKVAFGPSGDAVVLYTDGDWDTEADEIWSRRITADGVWLPAEWVGAGSASEASLVVDANGAAVVVWQGQSRRSTRSEGWGSVIPTLARGQLAADGLGRVIAVWPENGELWTTRFTPEAGWGLIESIGSGATKVHLAVAAAGDAVVVWADADGIGWNRFIPSAGWASSGSIEGAGTVGVGRLRVGLSDDGSARAVWTNGLELYASDYQ